MFYRFTRVLVELIIGVLKKGVVYLLFGAQIRPEGSWLIDVKIHAFYVLGVFAEITKLLF